MAQRKQDLDGQHFEGKYDDAEALRLLADAAASVPASVRAHEAGVGLLREVSALPNTTSVVLTKDGDHVVRFTLLNRSVWLKHVGQGRFAIYQDMPMDFREPSKLLDRMLAFNQVTDLLEGTEEAPSTTPFSPTARRSALAVGVEETLHELKVKIATR